MDIRDATKDDLSEIASIYEHYIKYSTATFEDINERSTNFDEQLDSLRYNDLPFVVAVDRTSGNVCGYAWAKLYHVRFAYRFTVEDTVYIHPEYTGKGIGRELLGALIEKLKKTSRKQVIAVMSIMPTSREEDMATCRLHRSFGFKRMARMKSVGFKFGEWIDVLYYQLDLQGGSADSSE